MIDEHTNLEPVYNNNVCNYPGCSLPANNPYCTDKCIFHAPSNQKGIDLKTYFQKLVDYVRNNGDYNFNFKGFVFHEIIDFKSILAILNMDEVNCDVNFNHCLFEGVKQRILKDKELNIGFFFQNIIFNKNVIFDDAIFTEGMPSFSNSIFKGENVSFKRTVFKEGSFFYKSEFYGDNLIFLKTKFQGIKLTLSEVKFNCKNVKFEDAEIDCEEISFEESEFHGESFLFIGTKINADKISFDKFNFHSGIVSISDSVFDQKNGNFNTETYFTNMTFNGKNLFIVKSIFSCGEANFSNSIFNKNFTIVNSEFLNGISFNNVTLNGNIISNQNKEKGIILEIDSQIEKNVIDDIFNFANLRILQYANFNKIKFTGNVFLCFEKLIFEDHTIFYFQEPLFELLDENKENIISICFNHIIFKPFYTFFENINPVIENNNAYLIFRNCLLQDIYFTNNNMKYFSFYGCHHERAVFIKCSWFETENDILKLFKYKRKNILLEESILSSKLNNSISNELIERLDIENLDSYLEIANMYRNMKTSLDGTKDYQEAGRFYFNEFEMLRLCNKNKIGLMNRCKYYLYSTYKIFAGYGEKPLWSFIWLLIFTTLLSVFNLLNGYKFRTSLINYDIIKDSDYNYSFYFWTWLKDIVKSVFFTISRILPSSYIPIDKTDFGTTDSLGLIVSIVTALILILFVTLIFSGLKRHFKRF